VRKRVGEIYRQRQRDRETEESTECEEDEGMATIGDLEVRTVSSLTIDVGGGCGSVVKSIG